ncbi:hypothetical protein C8R44DRAFT_823465, partial [Mycena epipterygia]
MPCLIVSSALLRVASVPASLSHSRRVASLLHVSLSRRLPTLCPTCSRCPRFPPSSPVPLVGHYRGLLYPTHTHLVLFAVITLQVSKITG